MSVHRENICACAVPTLWNVRSYSFTTFVSRLTQLPKAGADWHFGWLHTGQEFAWRVRQHTDSKRIPARTVTVVLGRNRIPTTSIDVLSTGMLTEEWKEHKVGIRSQLLGNG